MGKLYDPPTQPIPLLLAANGPKAMKLAGEHGDGLITDPQTWKQHKSEWESGARSAGKDPSSMPVLVEAFVVVGDQGEAQTAAKLWNFIPKAFKGYQDIPDPAQIERRAETELPLPEVFGDWTVSADPDAHVQTIKKLFDSGVTIVNIHSGQPDQQKVIEFYGRKCYRESRNKRSQAELKYPWRCPPPPQAPGARRSAPDETGRSETVMISGQSERARSLEEAQRLMPSKIPTGSTRGWIVPIGGAENKENDRHILERFLEVSGGDEADIVVIPTASRMHETGPRYERLFDELGAKRVSVMDFDTRRDCQEAGRLQRIEEATGIFFTGGNQFRLTTLLGGTPVAKLIRVRNAHGVTVGGTSAGASILSEHMIAFGDEGSAVISGSVRLAPGLGLTNRFIIDQHFRQRDRLGRLITALAYNPFAVGIGLDEDTAAFIGPDETVEVQGSGGVTIVDASEVSYSSIGEVGEGQPVCMLGLRLAYFGRRRDIRLE